MSEDKRILAAGRVTRKSIEYKINGETCLHIVYRELVKLKLHKTIANVSSGLNRRIAAGEYSSDLLNDMQGNINLSSTQLVPEDIAQLKDLADKNQTDCMILFNFGNVFLQASELEPYINRIINGNSDVIVVDRPSVAQIYLFSAKALSVMDGDKGKHKNMLDLIEACSDKLRVEILKVSKSIPASIMNEYYGIKLIEHFGQPYEYNRFAELIYEHPSLKEPLKSIRVELKHPGPDGKAMLPRFFQPENLISADSVIQLMDQINMPGSPWIELGIFGNPIMHPEFKRIVSALKERKDVRARLSCTGAAIGPEMLEEITDWPFLQYYLRMEQPVKTPGQHPAIKVLNHLSVSKGKQLQELLKDPDFIVKKPFSPLLILEVGFTSSSWSMVPGIAKKWDFHSVALRDYESLQSKPDIYERGFWDYFYRKFPPLEKTIFRQYSSFNGRMNPDRFMDCTPVERNKCLRIANTLTVLSDGKWALCSQDIPGEHSSGNIENTDPWDLWFSDKLCEKRRKVLPAGDFCNDCDVWFQPVC